MFGSEAKAIFASGQVAPEPDLAGLDEVFTLWGPRPPRDRLSRASARSRPAACSSGSAARSSTERRWWKPDLPSSADGSRRGDLEELLRDSVRLRLRADVPVGDYLSGGLDSSLITALAQQETDHELRTFSVAFHDPALRRAAAPEGGRGARSAPTITSSRSARRRSPTRFPEVVWHTETPLVRTAPVPMYLLARAVRANAITVVATGEGADELFWGYDLFKEVALRELHGTDPERAPSCSTDLYRYLGASGARRGPAWARFILETGAGDDPLSSHLTRVARDRCGRRRSTGRARAELNADGDSLDRLREGLPAGFGDWAGSSAPPGWR